MHFFFKILHYLAKLFGIEFHTCKFLPRRMSLNTTTLQGLLRIFLECGFDLIKMYYFRAFFILLPATQIKPTLLCVANNAFFSPFTKFENIKVVIYLLFILLIPSHLKTPHSDESIGF